MMAVMYVEVLKDGNGYKIDVWPQAAIVKDNVEIARAMRAVAVAAVALLGTECGVSEVFEDIAEDANKLIKESKQE